MADPTEAGWYEDPENPERLRFHDGAQWTRLAGEVARTAPATPAIAYVYASELIDGHTCPECRAIDGKRYANLAEAQEDYPALVGLGACSNPDGCRGSAIIVYDTEVPATVKRTGR